MYSGSVHRAEQGVVRAPLRVLGVRRGAEHAQQVLRVRRAARVPPLLREVPDRAAAPPAPRAPLHRAPLGPAPSAISCASLRLVSQLGETRETPEQRSYGPARISRRAVKLRLVFFFLASITCSTCAFCIFCGLVLHFWASIMCSTRSFCIFCGMDK